MVRLINNFAWLNHLRQQFNPIINESIDGLVSEGFPKFDVYISIFMNTQFGTFLLLAFLMTGFGISTIRGQQSFPTPEEGDYVIKNFPFQSGESMPELTLHYTTIGHPVKDKDGKTLNAILIMHGTTGDGHQFLSPQFSDGLFKAGQLLDATKYYIILPDGIGHGKS